MTNFNLENCKYDFASDNINIIVCLYDYSSSMGENTGAMRKANQAFYDDFSKFEERGSIAIAKGRFADRFSMSTFDEVKNFDTTYYPDGNTALYSSIVYATQNTIEYYNEIIKRLNIRPKITFLVFTDGEDNRSQLYYSEARDAIKQLNSLDATTVFVAFGAAIQKGDGESLGFSCIKTINTAQELISCMGNELSKSCKEQSKSAISLKSNFFSKADKNSQEDVVTDQTVFADDFFNV